MKPQIPSCGNEDKDQDLAYPRKNSRWVWKKTSFDEEMDDAGFKKSPFLVNPKLF